MTESLDPETKAKLIGDTPMGSIATPDDFRGIAAWLASDASSFCTGSEYVLSAPHAWVARTDGGTAASSYSILVSGGHTLW